MKHINSLMNKFAVVIALAVTFTLLTIGIFLLSNFPEESGIVLTLGGLLCAGISMFVISEDSSNRRKVNLK